MVKVAVTAGARGHVGKGVLRLLFPIWHGRKRDAMRACSNSTRATWSPGCSTRGVWCVEDDEGHSAATVA